MNQIFLCRGIVVPRGKPLINPLSIRNYPRGRNPQGRFFYPSLPDEESIEGARKRAERRAVERCMKPGLEPYILILQINAGTFEIIKGRLAIYYLAGNEEPLRDFEQLIREAEDVKKNPLTELTLNGKGLTEDDMRKLNLVVGSRDTEGNFVYKSYDEQRMQREGARVRGKEN